MNHKLLFFISENSVFTISTVCSPDFNSSKIGQNSDEILGFQSRGPLGRRTLIQAELVVVRGYTRHLVSLNKYGRRETLVAALKYNVHNRGTGVLFSDPQVKTEELVVAETLVTKVLGWKIYIFI